MLTWDVPSVLLPNQSELHATSNFGRKEVNAKERAYTKNRAYRASAAKKSMRIKKKSQVNNNGDGFR